MTAQPDKPGTAIPSREEAAIATEASRLLATLPQDGELRVHLDDGQELVIPRSATRLLAHILTEMSNGNAVTIIPVHAEMTTQEAADFLNVSRPYLIGLLEKQKIRHHKVGTHRRVRFQDLQEYKNAQSDAAGNARTELAKEAQELDMGY